MSAEQKAIEEIQASINRYWATKHTKHKEPNSIIDPVVVRICKALQELEDLS